MTGPSRPRVVAIGGGHGLAATLRATARYAGHTTAIVSVADDGGSSGKLRELLGIPPPGDIRKCLVALAPPDHELAAAYEHRFEDGHALGNLVIAALAATTHDFTEAIRLAGAAIQTNGTVLPATATPVVLKAEAAAGAIQGQVNVSTTGRISHVSLVPPDPPAPPQAIQAIAEADQIVIGPGSLFTSVLAACSVPDIKAAINQAKATKVYVANLRPQIPETAGYDVAAHVEALAAHGIDPDVVLYDDERIPAGQIGIEAVRRRLASPDNGHDAGQLATALANLVG